MRGQRAEIAEAAVKRSCRRQSMHVSLAQMLSRGLGDNLTADGGGRHGLVEHPAQQLSAFGRRQRASTNLAQASVEKPFLRAVVV